MYAAIDPGSNGALVIETSPLTFIDFKSQNLQGYIHALKSNKVDLCIVEKVHSMPKQGVSSTFSFGQRLGEIEGILQALEIPYIMVSPQVWQKAIGIPAKADKKTIANTLIKLYPSASIYGAKGGLLDGRSDALGLLHYAHTKYKEE